MNMRLIEASLGLDGAILCLLAPPPISVIPAQAGIQTPGRIVH
jgi:hypothetical protein